MNLAGKIVIVKAVHWNAKPEEIIEVVEQDELAERANILLSKHFAIMLIHIPTDSEIEDMAIREGLR